MDNSFSDADIQNYKKYAEAFFPGAPIGILKQGQLLPGVNPTKKTVPKNFMGTISSRERNEIKKGFK